jgi:hypothetical protein
VSYGITSEVRFLVGLGVVVAASVLSLVVGHPSVSAASMLGAVIGLSGGLAAIAGLRWWSARAAGRVARRTSPQASRPRRPR